jgi:CDP-diacylglycerol--glycerol-3-phosphate 3-phosphatidyltransferase
MSIQPASPTTEVAHNDMRFNTTPNHLTLLRMAFVPVVVGMLAVRNPVWDLAAGWTFAAASITDYFDGYLARTQKIETVYGKLLDPLADKFLVVSSLIMLEHLGRIHYIVVMLLICREMAITGLRALASAEGVIIPASQGGKWKTATQMAAIPFLMPEQDLMGLPTFTIAKWLLYISLTISLWSAKDYAMDFLRAAKEKRRNRAQERKLRKEARRAAREARRAKKKS